MLDKEKSTFLYYTKKIKPKITGLLTVTGMLIVLGCLTMNIVSCGNVVKEKSEFAPEDEKRLTIYTSHKVEVYGPIIKEFEEQTGIWVDVTAGGTNELLEQIANESERPVCDVMFGGGVENLEAYDEYFTPYECKDHEQIAEDFVYTDHHWTAFSALPVVIIYNNKLVYETAAPTGWDDLMQERWKGKLAFANPYNSGSSYTTLATMIQALGEEENETLKRLADTVDKKELDGSGDVIDAVIKGTKLVGITLEETALKRIAAGADITMVYPKEGTSMVPDGSALVKGAPHESNAKLFLDFIISQDVQKLIVDEFYRRSIRSDIKPLNEQAVDVKVINYDLEWASSHQEELLKSWSELIQ